MKLYLIYLKKKRLCFWYLNKPLKNKLLNNLHWSYFWFLVFFFVNIFFSVRVTECRRWTFCYIEINNLKLEVCQVFTENRRPWDEFWKSGLKDGPIYSYLLNLKKEFKKKKKKNQMLVQCRKANSFLVAGIHFHSISDNLTESNFVLAYENMWKSITHWHDSHALFAWRLPVFLQRPPVRLLVLVCWFQWLCTSFSVFMQFHLQYVCWCHLYMRWSYLCTVDRCVRYTYRIQYVWN